MFSLALTLGLTLWSAKRQDGIAVAGSRHLAATAVRVQQSSIVRTLTDYTYWDDAYENTVESFDPEWYDDEFSHGDYLADTFGITASFLIGPDNRIIRHMHESEILESAPELSLDRHVEGGIERLIADARIAVEGEFEGRSGLVNVEDQIHVAAVRVIHPHSEDLFEKAAITPENAYVAIFMRPLEDDLLETIAHDFGLMGLAHFADANASGDVTLPLWSADGQSYGSLVWQIDRPSRFVLNVLLPSVIGVSLFVCLLYWWVLNNLQRAQVALTRCETQFKQALAIARLGYWQTDGPDVMLSGELAAILGMPDPHECRMPYEEYLERFVHADDRDRVKKEADTEVAAGAHFETQYRLATSDGEERWCREIGESLVDESGTMAGMAGTVQDVTEIKHSEERLTQAQKMEAVGQLTGGLAHDFNNLLAVISGNVELLSDRLGTDDQQLQSIHRATRRGSELTQRLLAFSRRQPLDSQVIDLGDLASDMTQMISRTLGETIEIEITAAPDLWPAMADPGQVENALLNLAINARDAMPEGGRLTIQCENAQLDAAYAELNPGANAGDYVCIVVSDTGTGMSAAIRAKAFQPFFSTKEVGQGSGLGLSMIYGFAKQSGGHVTIYSEEGHGTTVKLFLPKATEMHQAEEAPQSSDIPRGTCETVLVIEDDPDVRSLTVQMLEALDYRMVEATDVAAARTLLANGAQIDLVLSDVVLPGGISGLEFAEELRRTHPDQKIIFMSGYPAEVDMGNGFLGRDSILLSKPFSRQQLAAAMREALG